MDVERWRGVTGGRNGEQVQEAGGEEGNEGDALGDEVVSEDYEDVSEVADERSWLRFRAGHLGKNTEGYVFAAQEQALGTKLVLKACS